MYKCILMDPPWLESGGGKIKRGADKHYPLLKTQTMPQVIYQSGVWEPAPNAHLWMWATNNFLPDALWLMEALNFRYITNAVWVKNRMSLGQYLRGQHELLLLGVRGRGPLARTERKDLTTLILPSEPQKRVHSRKPDASYKLIEARSMGPRLEIFGRTNRPGWDTWGQEADGAS